MATAAGLNFRWAFAGTKLSFHPGLLGAILPPGFGLFWAVWADYDFQDGQMWDVIVCVIGAAAIFVPAFIDRKNSEPSKFAVRTWYAGAVLVGILCYADAAVKQLDVWLDTSTPTVYHPTVLDRRSRYHRRLGSSYYVTVSAWGPHEEPDEISVSQSFHDRAQDGMRLCARAYDGYFKLRYDTVEFCD